MTKPEFKPYDNEERLRQLYYEAGMSQNEIGNLFGVSSSSIARAMKRHGLSRYTNKKRAKYRTRHDGYEAWDGPNKKGVTGTIYVHQIVAIANGADPSKVFGNDEWVIHHKNGVKWDNRPENLTLLNRSEHTKRHVEQGDIVGNGRKKVYDKQDLIEWIDSFVKQFGFVPTAKDIKGWPGPSEIVYKDRFGTFTNAVEKAGYEPRGK